MSISLFDLLKVGIGPSSSHTVGPMKAANVFASLLNEQGNLSEVTRLRTQLFGSLGATGKGHGSGNAVLMGLEGHLPESIDPEIVVPRSIEINESAALSLLGQYGINFDPVNDLIYHDIESLPYHANGISFEAWDSAGELILRKEYYSVGGGFIVDQEEAKKNKIVVNKAVLPYPFESGNKLLEICEKTGLSISQVMFENEKTWRSEDEIRDGILALWKVMQECVKNGIRHEGILPGGLNVKRRASALHRTLKLKVKMDIITPSLGAMDWVNLYALAVNEENAAGGRIVTAPTNGAAGIIPAVLHYYKNFCPNSDDEGVIDFFLTASAIGILFKMNASISGAEVGCQGEVGSACAMAAAGLAQVTGGSPKQVENAAEIGMEHNLGLTCDPIAGLVQIPCIERNAMASMKAINAASLALRGDGEHFVSLDKVIITMRETGKDMLDKYKETSRGGLAVNVVEC